MAFLRAKPIGVMQMIDQGEQDDKVIHDTFLLALNLMARFHSQSFVLSCNKLSRCKHADIKFPCRHESLLSRLKMFLGCRSLLSMLMTQNSRALKTLRSCQSTDWPRSAGINASLLVNPVLICA